MAGSFLQLFLWLTSVVTQPPFDPHMEPRRPPFFEGWYMRLTDEANSTSVGLVIGYTNPSTGLSRSPPHPLNYAAMLLAAGEAPVAGDRNRNSSSTSSAWNGLEVHEVFPRKARISVDPQDPQPCFGVHCSDGSCDLTAGQGALHLRVSTQAGVELSVHATVPSPGLPWQQLNPEGLAAYLPLLPLHWYLHTLALPAEYVLRRCPHPPSPPYAASSAAADPTAAPEAMPGVLHGCQPQQAAGPCGAEGGSCTHGSSSCERPHSITSAPVAAVAGEEADATATDAATACAECAALDNVSRHHHHHHRLCCCSHGRGLLHMEKNWGTAFPRSWVWSQGHNLQQQQQQQLWASRGGKQQQSPASSGGRQQPPASTGGRQRSEQGRLGSGERPLLAAAAAGTAPRLAAVGNATTSAAGEITTTAAAGDGEGIEVTATPAAAVGAGASFAVAGGPLPGWLGWLLPRMWLLAWQAEPGAEPWAFRPYSTLYRGQYHDACAARLFLVAVQLTRKLALDVTADPGSFAELACPERDGFHRNCSVQSYAAEARVRTYTRSWRWGLLPGPWTAAGEWSSQRVAIEFGGSARCRE